MTDSLPAFRDSDGNEVPLDDIDLFAVSDELLAAMDPPTDVEYGLIIDGGNVQIGFHTWEEAVDYAKGFWDAKFPEGYGDRDDFGCGDFIDTDSPVISIFQVTQASDWSGVTVKPGNDE